MFQGIKGLVAAAAVAVGATGCGKTEAPQSKTDIQAPTPKTAQSLDRARDLLDISGPPVILTKEDEARLRQQDQKSHEDIRKYIQDTDNSVSVSERWRRAFESLRK